MLNSSIFVPSFSRMKLQVLTFSIHLFYSVSLTNAVSELKLFPGLHCSYNFNLEVHAHRGKRSTKELNFKMNGQVDVEILNEHSVQNDAFIIRLRLNRLRIIRLKNGGRIKHAVDPDLEKKLSRPFFFLQDVKGNITKVFFPHDDQPELVGLKKGIVSSLNLKIHPDIQNISYSAVEEDESGIHHSYYNIYKRNVTNLHLTKKWSSDDYLKHADRRPVEGRHHTKSHYDTTLEIENGAIKNVKRTHFSHFRNDKRYSRPQNKPEFQRQPDLELKASGQSHLNLLRCAGPTNRRIKRSSEKMHAFLRNLKQATLCYDGVQDIQWSSIGDPNKPSRTFYELLRCYSDPSVKKSELSQCVKELHHLARTNDDIFKNIVNLTLERSHHNFSTWSGLVGAIVVRGDHETQKILSRAILSEDPRPLADKEHAKLLEAVYFIPAGPLYPELLQALLSLHMNLSKSADITVRSMLVLSGLVRRCHDSGYNRSLSESIVRHLHQSFKTHPAQLHDAESSSHEGYIWSHLCAFGNLGHISSLGFIARYLDHDSSGIRYFAVSALRKLPSHYTDHHLLRILRTDEHVTVKAGVIEVLLERRQNLTNEMRDAIEDALWISEEGDELDSKILEFLENHDEKSHHVIRKLRKKRSNIRRKKRALIPALKPREFSLGVRKEWRKAFGGSQVGAEAVMQFVNEAKLKIGIFGGRFEVNLDNLALFRAHVIMWSFDIVNGKAAFRMGAGFKNDIPKDLIHTIADTADDILASIDGISSIFTKHIQKFLDKLKKYLPFIPDIFLNFISETVKILGRTIQVSRFGNFFNNIVINLRNAWRASEAWLKVGDLVKSFSRSLSNINLSKGSFEGAFRFLNKFVDLLSKLRLRLPRNFPIKFNIKNFLTQITGPFESTSDAVEHYFKTLGVNFPTDFFEMFHFNVTLNFIPILDKFKIATLRLVHFGNNFLEMLSVFRDMFNVNLPQLNSLEFSVNNNKVKDFDFGLSFDWRMKFNFSIDFSGPDFAKFRKMFHYLVDIFRNLSKPNVNFEKFFGEILSDFKIKFESDGLLIDGSGSNAGKWFKSVLNVFHNFVNQFDFQLFELGSTSNFLDKLSKIVERVSKGSLAHVCKLQDFMLKSAGNLALFGEKLEEDMIHGIRNVGNRAQMAIAEVINITLFVDQFIDEIKQNLSYTTKTFVGQHLAALESSLKSVKQLANIVATFSLKSANKLTGFCHKTANISGEMLDKVQSAAEKAVSEIADFVTSNSEGFVTLIDQFKVVVKSVENWHQEYLAKHLGKVAIVSQTINEFLSLIKTENTVFLDIYKVFKNINNVIQYLNNLPTHAQKAYDFAVKIENFATNAEGWRIEFEKLNIRKKFNLDFDEKLRIICNEFQSFAEDTIKQIQGDNLFKTFREFVTRETDSLISQSVSKLDLLKTPLGKARNNLEEMSSSVLEIEVILVELRPFLGNFLPVLQEIRRLPNCSDIYVIFDNIITSCGKQAISFGKQAYSEYASMKTEVKAFLELLPEEWESLSLQQCISGGTCLVDSFKKQAQSVLNKMQKLKNKFHDFNFKDKIETCEKNVEEVSRIFGKIQNISMLVKEFSFKEEIVKIKDLSARITGKYFGNDDESQVKRRTVSQPIKIERNIAEYTRMAEKTQEIIKRLVEQVFTGLEEVSQDLFGPFQVKLENVVQKLNVSLESGKNSAVIGPILQPLQSVVETMIGLIQTGSNVVDPLKGTISDVLFKISDFIDVFEGKLKNYGQTVTKVSEEANNLIAKITSFLNTIQLRQKGLDIRDYQPWDQYQHCSTEVCLRLIRRSSELYLSTIFVWKYPHLDDLSSTTLSGTGRWLVPGLFDDYKIRGIAQLSNNEMLLGMRGVAANTEKASLLVVVDITSSNSEILKIVQLEMGVHSFQGNMGGVVVVKSLIWISSGNSLYGVRISDVRNSMSSKRPSTIAISKIKALDYQIISISYDDRDRKIWVLESSKAHSYDVSPFGDILLKKNSLVTEEHTRGFTIVRQLGIKYACVAKCSFAAGYQCRLEFHKMDAGVLDESTVLRVVRTPTGLEAIQTVDTEHVVAAFSSGTFSDKDKIQRIGGDFEDRYFKFNVPVLKTEFSITENCLYFKVGWDWIIPQQRLFPFGEMKCGIRRKRHALEKALDKDIYTDELDKHLRTKRQATEEVSCIWNIEGEPYSGTFPIVPEVSFTIVVFFIPVKFFFGADLYYYANYRISLCLPDKEVRLALIPGVWLTVYAGASVPLIIVEAGITIEAQLLETYLIPELIIRVHKWPLSACIQLKMQMTPLRIRVYFWYRFRLCVKISYKKWFSLRISINWCPRKTLAEWTWSSSSIHKILFDNCDPGIDQTRPGVGVCNAKQVGNKKYFIQWRGFTEDTQIQSYIVKIGSIPGSGDDHYSIHNQRQSLLVPDLEIMHGRSVYVGVYAINGVGLKSDVAHCPEFTANRRSPVVTFINDGDSSKDIDYQTDTTSLGMKYSFVGTFDDLSSVKWGISSSTTCTLSESEADILPLQNIGETYTVKKTGMNFTSGSKYYTRVVVVSHLGLATVACSDGVTIDTTPPIPRNFTIGRGGSKLIPSVRRVSGNFQHFIDNESPIVHYEWKLIDESTEMDVTSFIRIPLTQMSPLLAGLSLTSGQKYTAVLKGTNAAGLHAEVHVSGIIPDNTMPLCNVLPRDVIGFDDVVDRNFVSHLMNLTAMFSCYDDDSGIQSIQAGVGTYPGGADVHSFVDINDLTVKVSEDMKATWVTFVNVSITTLTRYHVTINVEDMVGNRKTVSSDGILMDITEPTVLPTYIRDGFQGMDKKYSNEFDVFPAHWENAFADSESGIGEYFVGLGSTPGLDDKSAFRSHNLSTKALLSGDSLESGVKYYVTVIACNRVGMCVNGSSNGAIVDYLPPHTGLVIAGHEGPPLQITWINKAAWARWQWCSADRSELRGSPDTCDSLSFYDVHSGIRRFGLTVLSYDTADMLTPVKIVGRVVSSGLHVAMPNGVFSVVVEAQDRAGGKSNAISNSFIVDTTPPKIVKLYHGLENQQIVYSRTKNHQFMAFLEINEDISDIVSYSVGVSTFPEGDDIISFAKYKINVVANVIRVNWTSANSQPLVNGRKYYITVKGTNAAGLFSITSSPALIFDNEPPLVSHVFDGWGTQDSQYHPFPNIYRMHWQGISDFSGIEKIEVCLSSIRDENECNLYPKVKIPNKEMSYTFTNVSLQSGVYCYAYLGIKDKAGNYGKFWSNGALTDTSPPRKGRVTDGQRGSDIDFQRQTNILHASWSGFSEEETVIHHYELAFGTSPNETNVQPFTNVGLVTSSSSSNLLVSGLKNGVVYYAQIVAYNTLGIRSDIAVSNGVLVEITPPVFLSPVSDGIVPGFDFDYSSNLTSLSVTWKCEDKESGLRQVLVTIGTQPGIQDVVRYRAVLPYQNLYNFNALNLATGLRYFSTVKCINNVGLHNSVSSDGITIDSTPPVLSYVYIGSKRNQDSPQIGLSTFVTANWKFKDFDSTIIRYTVSIHHVENTSQFAGPWVFPGNQTSGYLNLAQNNLAHKERYVLWVAAMNGAGLRTTGISNAFLVDGTAPICTNIYDATLDGEKTSFNGFTSKLAVHANCNDNETGIFKYEFAIKDIKSHEYAVPFHSVRIYLASLVVVDGFGKQHVKLQNGNRYQVGLRVTNNVNITSEYWTSGVTIDTTAPKFRKVVSSYNVHRNAFQVVWELSDHESGIRNICWSLNTSPNVENPDNFTELLQNAKEVFISDVRTKVGVTYYVYLKATNNAGISTVFVSNGVVVDQTPPLAGRVSAEFVLPENYDGNPNMTNGASFPVRWSGFIDQESGVRSYKWAIGPTGKIAAFSDDSFSEIQFTGSTNGYIIEDQIIHTDTLYYVCIRATNGAGLWTTNCSDGLRVKLGKLTPGVVYDGPLDEDIDFQLDDKAIWLHWSGFKDPVYGLKRYSWCYGLFSNAENDTFNCLSSLMSGLPPHKGTAHKFYNLSLAHGKRYGAKVVAVNQREEVVSAVSDGFIVDRTPPNAGILEIGGSQGTRTLYLTSLSAPIVSWSAYESESALQEFQVGIGTFPNCDDLFSFTKVNGSTYSFNLDEAQFDLTHGLAFYITIVGVNVLGLETRIISPQIVVDSVPPIPSLVRDGNGTDDIDFQSDVERISATWNEFLDAESDVVEYFYCIGSRSGFCNIVNRTSVALELRADAKVRLEHGQTYFVSVTAINNAGLSTTSSSNGVTIDTSPPVVQSFSVTSAITIDQNTTNGNISSDVTAVLTNRCKIFATWDYILDEESEVKRVSVCATTNKEQCDLLMWQDHNPDSPVFSLDFLDPLQSGTVVKLKLFVENGAGLKTTLISSGVLVDNSPPEKGFVQIEGKDGLVFLQNDQPLIALWWGFNDFETGIKEYKWRICFALKISDCVAEFVSVGLKNSVALNDTGIIHGKEYKFVVKAVNLAGLEIESVSNSFILDNTSPETGIVFNGLDSVEDKNYQSSLTEILAGWKGFQDKESGISRYDICIGSIPGLCDISGFRNVGLVTNAIVSNLNLTHNATYYTTVRGTNGASQSGFASSNGITVDLTPPIGSILRDGEDLDTDVSRQDMFVSTNWDEFYDSESGISKYVVCAGTIVGACDLVSPTKVNDSLSAKLEIRPAVSSGTVVFSTLWAYNKAGVVTKVHSDGVLVDTTPPNAGIVEITSPNTGGNSAIYLTTKELLCASWNTFNDTETAIESYHFSLCSVLNRKSCPISRRNLNNETSICIEDPPVTEGDTYFVVVIATNLVGLSSSSKSSHFVIDSTEPNIGQIIASNPLQDNYNYISSSLLARWKGFSDKESGISEYHICVGMEPGLCDIKESVSAGKASQYRWSNLSLVSTEEYFVSIRSTNNAGLSTDYVSSVPFVVDTTAAFPQEIFDGTKNGEDIDYQQGRDQLSASWFKIEDPESNIVALSWCVGTTPASCDQIQNTPIDVTSTKVSTVLPQPAADGNRYYVTLTATNSAGLSTTMVSDGVTIDYTSPRPGVVVVGKDDSMGHIKNGDAIYAHWSGFEDAVSGIISYQFALCEMKNSSSCALEFTNIGLQTNITLSGLDLDNGKGYVVIVRATDFVGLNVKESSNEFMVDETPPVSGWISIVSPSPTDFDVTQITSTWGNFYDPESELSGYEICLGKSQGECDEIGNLPVGLNTTYSFHNLSLRHKEEYYVSVKASNMVGLSTKVTSNGIKVDLTPPKPVWHKTGSSDGVCNGVFGSCDEQTSAGLGKENAVKISCEDDLLNVAWVDHEDKESGIALTEWCVETVNNTCNILTWESLPPNTLTTSATVHSLPAITAVRVVVRITNGVGNDVLLKSSRCNPEQVFPPTVNVSIIHQLNDSRPVSVYQSNQDIIIVTWSLPRKEFLYSRVQAALSKYDQNPVANTLNKWHGEYLVFDFVNIPTGKSHIIFSGERLKPYVKYRPVVRLCNNLGLCTDSNGDPVVIIPDAPPDIQINTTDTVQGTEQDRWQKYVGGLPRLAREVFEETLFVPDPLSVLIKADLKRVNDTTLFNKHVPVTFKANVYRVTSGANETINETVENRQIFNNSHLYSSLDVCCSKINMVPKIVTPDRRFIPVVKTQLFGVTISTFAKDLVIASSKNAVYMLSTDSLHVTPISHVAFNTSINDSYVKVKAKNDTILVFVAGSLVIQKHDSENFTMTSSLFYITNCNQTMIDAPKHCYGNDQWSYFQSVGQEFAYDGSEFVAVSGRDPHEHYGVVAVFKSDSNQWKLHQVIGRDEIDFTVPYSIAINQHFLVVAGSEIRVYSKRLDFFWKKEATISRDLPQILLGSKTVYLTNESELFILSKQTKTLHVYELVTSSPIKIVRKCNYVFSKDVELSGSMDVSESSTIVAAIAMRLGARDGAELILYKRSEGCVSLGGVFSRSEARFDDSHAAVSVAITERYLIVGTPRKVSWPSDYVNVGTGRLYVTTFCERNHVRKKVFEADQKERIVCMPCGQNEKAYPGFQEQCTNCSNTICLNHSTDATFKLSHCDTYPCGIENNQIVRQNVSRDNLTVTESTQDFEDQKFYLPGSTQSYFVRLTQVSMTGVTKISDSFPFSIDYTSPEAGTVFDGLGSDDSQNCSANTTFSSEHQCTSRSFSETDLDYTNNTYEISARWLDFRDDESNIAHYFWCVGSKPLRDNILPCENATNRLNRTLKGLSLQHNDKYYVTVLACNYAGLCTAVSSDGVLVDTTPPVLHYVRDGLVGPDIDFQVFTNVIFGNWDAEDPESGVVSYEIGWGSEPGLDDVWEFQEIGNASRWYGKFGDEGLEKGRKFYVTVKAINGAGLESEPMTSNGITVGKTEFVFARNDSGSFFFDTVNVDENETREDTEVGNTFGTVDVPAGAVGDDVKFQMYSVGDKEFKNGTDDNTTIVDPKVIKPPKHFKLGDYSFQIKAYETENNTLQSNYRFKKPITITLVYDVDQMLKQNQKVVSDDVTNEDIDPVLLLWDEKNQTWFDAAKTCPEPSTYVDKEAKVLKVKVCHLTQFALFWTFEAENGIFEFHGGTNDSLTKSPPHGVIEESNTVIYRPERYAGEMILDVVRYKGSTGAINVAWGITVEPNTPSSFIVTPKSGEVKFSEGQWNSSIHLRFPFILETDKEIEIFVKLLSVSDGAMLGNFTSVKITFPPNVGDGEVTKPVEEYESNEANVILKILLPCLSGALLIIGIIAASICLCKGKESKKRVRRDSTFRINPIFGTPPNLDPRQMETSFTDNDPPY